MSYEHWLLFGMPWTYEQKLQLLPFIFISALFQLDITGWKNTLKQQS